MTEPIAVQDPVVTEQPAAPVEHVYKYQPRDEAGAAMGGEQVIKYDGTPEDLGAKMADQNAKLIALNRKINKELRLSGAVREQIPDTAPRFDESKFQLTPEPLTAEERIKLSQDILDPEKFDSVGQRLVRATLGDPEALRTRLSRLEQQAAKSNALEEAQAFKNSNPDYYVCPDNFKTLANWIIKNGLEPVQENFQLAYDTLKEFMIPKPQAAPVVQKVDEPRPAIDPRPVSSGLTRSNGSDSGPQSTPGSDIVFGQWKGTEAIERMPGDEYKKRLLKEPGFKEKVQALDNARAQKRAGV